MRSASLTGKCSTSLNISPNTFSEAHVFSETDRLPRGEEGGGPEHCNNMFFHNAKMFTLWKNNACLINIYIYIQYMGVSKNTGTPKWMVYNGKPY